MKKQQHEENKKPTPLWVKIIAILLVVAMPVFFANYRGIQTQRAADLTETPVDQQPSEE